MTAKCVVCVDLPQRRPGPISLRDWCMACVKEWDKASRKGAVYTPWVARRARAAEKRRILAAVEAMDRDAGLGSSTLLFKGAILDAIRGRRG